MLLDAAIQEADEERAAAPNIHAEALAMLRNGGLQSCWYNHPFVAMLGDDGEICGKCDKSVGLQPCLRCTDSTCFAYLCLACVKYYVKAASEEQEK